MYDVTSKESFIQAVEYLKEFSQEKCIILLGNKIDLVQARTISYEEGAIAARSHQVLFEEVSAMECNNIETAVIKIVGMVLKQENEPSDWVKVPRNVPSLNNGTQKCCY